MSGETKYTIGSVGYGLAMLAIVAWSSFVITMGCRAQSDCAPRMGTWSFESGSVCYGEPAP